jgi:hypothetical protein
VSAAERAIECRTCGATHVPAVACPPVGRWLISGEPVKKNNRTREAS